jgi:ubiquinone/menaquinone biosynthesis C-methylase UbiE
MFTLQDIEKMNYVQLLASLQEINRPPGGKDSVRRIVQNTFLNEKSNVLDVGCNTGYSTFDIAHLVKCKVTGLDISEEMIKTANIFKSKDSYSDLIDFVVGDGMSLPFEDNTFDLTMSGGSTAFIDDKVKALQEYSRVTKTWGFVADVNFFYEKEPPNEMINELNTLMDINIQPWNKSYWLDVYKQTGLEMYYSYFNNVYVPSGQEIIDYCNIMTNNIPSHDDAKVLINERLVKLMTLFAENHTYLSYGVYILRKRQEPEQINLFGA